MKLILLGTGTLVPDPDRGPSGALILSEGASLLVDAGSGTLRQAARAGADAHELDGAVFTHRHLDHCGDLPALLFLFCNSVVRRRARPFPIWAGSGFGGYLEGLGALYGDWVTPKAFTVPIEELPLEGPGEAELPGGLRLQSRPARHSGGALHLRLTSREGASIVFSGDTGVSPDLVALAEDADLLVCECANEPGSTFPYHLSPDDVAELARQARPKRIILTHLYPVVDAAEAVRIVAATGIPVAHGADLMAVEL